MPLYDITDDAEADIREIVCYTLENWGLEKLTVKQATDLLEVVEDRHGVSSTIICSQLPVEQWHSMISNGTVADALLDRLIHNAHRITLTGESMRKQQTMR